MKRASIGVLLSLALILITANSNWGSKDEPKAGNPFEGRILTVYLKSGVVGACSIMKNVVIEDVAGTKSLVGIKVDHDDDEADEG